MSEDSLQTGTSSGDDVTVVNDEETLGTPAGVPVDGGDAEEGTRDVDFYNLHDGTKGRLKGVYLDEQERREAETARARVENREPDYENMPATAGTPLVTKAVLPDNSLVSNPSNFGVDSTAEPMATLPVDVSSGTDTTDVGYATQVANEDQERGTSTTVTGDVPTEVEAGHPDSAEAVLAELDAPAGDSDVHAPGSGGDGLPFNQESNAPEGTEPALGEGA